MTEKSPAFQFYPKDWLSDQNVMLMDNEARGIYIHLLCYCWLNGSIPNDVIQLAQLVNTDEVSFNGCWDSVGTCFQLNGNGRLTNRRLDKEKAKQETRRTSASEAGKASVKARKAKRIEQLRTVNDRSDSVPTKFNPSSSSSSSSSNLKTLSRKESEKEFLIRWKRYQGEKDNRKLALGHWNTSVKTHQDLHDYDQAEQNYYAIVAASFEGRSFKGGKTWMNNWRNYTDQKPPPKPSKGKIPPSPQLTQTELKVEICKAVAHVRSTQAEGTKMDFTFLHMGLGAYVTRYEDRFRADPLSKDERQWFDKLKSEAQELEGGE